MKEKKPYFIAFALLGVFASFLFFSEGNKQQEIRTRAASIAVSPGGSIQTALDAANTGDTVTVPAGTYTGAITFKKDGVTLQGSPGAIIDGAGNTARGLITFDGRSNITIAGMTVKNAGGHGMYGGGGVSNIAIKDNDVSGSKDGGIFVGDATNVVITGNKVHENNSGASGGDIGQAANEGITLFNTKTFEITNNTVNGNFEEGIDTKNGTSDGVIANNTVYDNNGPNIYVDGASNVKIYSNHVYGARGSSKAGIGLAVESGGASSNVEIYNNVIHDNPNGAIDFWIGTYSNVSVINNTTSNNNGKAISVNSGNVSGSVARNNIFFNDALNASGFTNDNNLTTDPNFVNAGSNDFHLNAGSPAIDKGLATGAPTTDFDGAARPVGAGIDMGAYEYGGTASVSTAPTAAVSTAPDTGAPSPTIFNGYVCLGECPTVEPEPSIPVGEPSGEVVVPSEDPNGAEPTSISDDGDDGGDNGGGGGHHGRRGLISQLLDLLRQLIELIMQLFNR